MENIEKTQTRSHKKLIALVLVAMFAAGFVAYNIPTIQFYAMNAGLIPCAPQATPVFTSGGYRVDFGALIALAVVTVVLIAVYFTGHVGLATLTTHTTSTYTTPTGVTH